MLKAACAGICGAILLLATAGCSRGPSDAVLTADAQNRLLGDHRVEARRVSLAASHGVLTLSGTVASEAERGAAAEDASRADGVKVLVNNLQVMEPVQAAQIVPPQKPPAAHAVLAVSPAHPAKLAEKSQPVVSPDPVPTERTQNTSAPPNPAAALPTHPVASPGSNATLATPSQPVAPALPPPVERVFVPAGTVLSVRLLDSIGSDVNDVGDKLTGSLASPVMIGDKVVIPTEAGVHGKVVQVQSMTTKCHSRAK